MSESRGVKNRELKREKLLEKSKNESWILCQKIIDLSQVQQSRNPQSTFCKQWNSFSKKLKAKKSLKIIVITQKPTILHFKRFSDRLKTDVC